MEAPRGATEEVRLAYEFLSTLTAPRAPWADLFTTWARERGLAEGLTRTVKVTVLRLRMFGSQRRRRSA